MPPPVDPYASLSSIAALSAEMNGGGGSFSSGSNQSKNGGFSKNQNFSGFDDVWSAFGSPNGNSNGNNGVPSSGSISFGSAFSPSNSFLPSSDREREERRKKEEQERADYEFALKLSQQSSEHAQNVVVPNRPPPPVPSQGRNNWPNKW